MVTTAGGEEDEEDNGFLNQGGMYLAIGGERRMAGTSRKERHDVSLSRREKKRESE